MDNPYADVEDARSRESFVVLDDVPAQQSFITFSNTESAEQDIAQPSSASPQLPAKKSFRGAATADELTAVLMDVWRPDISVMNDIGTSDEVPSRPGKVVNLDMENVLFSPEEHLKKLLALTAHPRAGFTAKTAAVDTFTWLCASEAVLLNPVFSKEDVCKWVMGLVSQNDPGTVSSGLRAIRNLVVTEEYTEPFRNRPDFHKVLDQIRIGGPMIRHADVYVLEIFHAFLHSNIPIPGRELILEFLSAKSMDNSLSVEGHFWAMQCVDAIIRQSAEATAALEAAGGGNDLCLLLEILKEAQLGPAAEEEEAQHSEAEIVSHCSMETDVNVEQCLTRLQSENAHLKDENRKKDITVRDTALELKAAVETIHQLNHRLQCSQSEHAPAIVELEATVKRLKRQLDAKEGVVSTLNEQIAKLHAEVRNREAAYAHLVETVDLQHERMVLLEDILKTEGFNLDD